MVTTLMVPETFLPGLGVAPAGPKRVQDPANMSVLQAWQWALAHGRAGEASALRTMLDGFDEEPTQVDAEWQ